MKTSERKEQQRQDTAEKILSAARELLISQGIAGLTMRNLATKVGYSPTAIYSYFADKDAVLRALMDTDCIALRRAMDDAATEPDPIERVRKMGQAYVGFGLRYPDHYRVLMLTEHDPAIHNPNDPRRGDPAQDAYALLRQAVADGLVSGRYRTEFTDPDQLVQIIWAGVHGIVALHLNLGRDPWFHWHPVEPTASLLIDATIRGLTALG
jgi:AcrR family transcriptional regulator